MQQIVDILWTLVALLIIARLFGAIKKDLETIKAMNAIQTEMATLALERAERLNK